jgi:hypothetical protein
MGRIHANGAHKFYMRDFAYLIYSLALEGPCKPIDPGIEAAASFFNSTGRHKQKTRPLKIEISANGRGFLELAYLGVGP